MRRSEASGTFTKFVEVKARLSAFLSGQEGDDGGFDQVKQEFDSLLGLLLSNLDIFTDDQREFIIHAKNVASTPRHRLGVARARSRSRSTSRS